MYITKTALPRRTFLRGLGATVALPLLDAMLPAGTALAQSAAAPRQRAGFIYIPHGADMGSWTPAAAGTGIELSPTLKTLEPFKDSLVIVSNLRRAGGQSAMHAAAACGRGGARKYVMRRCGPCQRVDQRRRSCSPHLFSARVSSVAAMLSVRMRPTCRLP